MSATSGTGSRAEVKSERPKEDPSLTSNPLIIRLSFEKETEEMEKDFSTGKNFKEPSDDSEQESEVNVSSAKNVSWARYLEKKFQENVQEIVNGKKEVEEIMGVTEEHGEKRFLIKWKGGGADFLPHAYMREHLTAMLIQFYEGRITWKTSTSGIPSS